IELFWRCFIRKRKILATESLNELSLLITGQLINHDSGNILNDLASRLNVCATEPDSRRQKIVSRPSTSAIVEILQNEFPTTKAAKSNRIPLFPAPKIVPTASAKTSIAFDSSASSSGILTQQTTSVILDNDEISVDNRLSSVISVAEDSSHKRRASQSFGDVVSMKNSQIINSGAPRNQILNEKALSGLLKTSVYCPKSLLWIMNSPMLVNETGPHTQKRLSSLETSAAYSRKTKQAIVLESVPRQAQLSKRRRATREYTL
uniref:Uncharacterized protein n=1 Tax=Romanomermis culicivorax TaxID=13658 RepID=A0A915J6A9_ROMCU